MDGCLALSEEHLRKLPVVFGFHGRPPLDAPPYLSLAPTLLTAEQLGCANLSGTGTGKKGLFVLNSLQFFFFHKILLGSEIFPPADAVVRELGTKIVRFARPAPSTIPPYHSSSEPASTNLRSLVVFGC